MREFLLELYLKHGMRAFVLRESGIPHDITNTMQCLWFLTFVDLFRFKLTPKAIEFLKRNDS